MLSTEKLQPLLYTTSDKKSKTYYLFGNYLFSVICQSVQIKREDGPSRNMYKGHMDKGKGGRFEGGR